MDKQTTRKDNMQVNTQLITPLRAEEMLKSNIKNRSIRPQNVGKMARDMLSGMWQQNGDAIRFNQDGQLIDGQHRLHACVKSGVSFRTLIITGLDNDVTATIDDGARRVHADRLSMAGVMYATTISGATRALTAVATGAMNTTLSTREMDAIIDANSGLHDSAAKVGRTSKVGSKASVAAYHYIINQLYGVDVADEFLGVWHSGIPAYDGDPVQKFRMRTLELKAGGKSLNQTEYYKLMSRAVIAFVTREPLKRLVSSNMRIPGWSVDKLGITLGKPSLAGAA